MEFWFLVLQAQSCRNLLKWQILKKDIGSQPMKKRGFIGPQFEVWVNSKLDCHWLRSTSLLTKMRLLRRYSKAWNSPFGPWFLTTYRPGLWRNDLQLNNGKTWVSFDTLNNQIKTRIIFTRSKHTCATLHVRFIWGWSDWVHFHGIVTESGRIAARRLSQSRISINRSRRLSIILFRRRWWALWWLGRLFWLVLVEQVVITGPERSSKMLIQKGIRVRVTIRYYRDLSNSFRFSRWTNIRIGNGRRWCGWRYCGKGHRFEPSTGIYRFITRRRR